MIIGKISRSLLLNDQLCQHILIHWVKGDERFLGVYMQIGLQKFVKKFYQGPYSHNSFGDFCLKAKDKGHFNT